MTTPTSIRIRVVLVMAKFESPVVVRRKLQVEFGNKTPSEVSIKAIFDRFCETGTVEDRARSERPSKVTEEKMYEVREVLEEPQSSVRSVATACSIPKTTAYRIMTDYLLLKPYKVQFVQELYEENLQDRVEMCTTLLPMLEDEDIQENLFFSDEATFYLNALVNKRYIRYWSENNPHVTIERVMKSPRLNVWCAMSKNQLIRPFLFQDDTVDGKKNYLSMLQNFFHPEIKRPRKFRSIIFQQDGAPSHFARDVRQYLDHQFPGRWIGRGGSIRWAPCSPDLIPLDFFLWGHLKNNVYKTPIKDLAQLKTKIKNEIESISSETLCDVFKNISKRMKLCIEVDGNHFESLV